MSPSPWPEHLLTAILSSTDESLLSFGVDGTIQAWSTGAARLYGYSPSEMMGQSVKRILPMHEVPAYEALLASCHQENLQTSEMGDRLHKSGSLIRVKLIHTPVRDGLQHVVAILEKGKLSNERPEDASLRSLLTQMPALLWTTDRKLCITSNWGSGALSGNIRAGELIGHELNEFLQNDGSRTIEFAEDAANLRVIPSHFEFRRWNRDFEIRIDRLYDELGVVTGFVYVGFDITERKRDEEQFRYQATHDELTGLANYRQFREALEREVRRAERSSRSFALLLLDLDDLKRINDRWGHLAGNRALRRLSEVLKQQCRSSDLAARYGGDEFAILLIDADPATARQIALRVESALERDREDPPLRVSIGTSIFPDNGRSAADLFEAADKKLYRNKNTSRTHILSAR